MIYEVSPEVLQEAKFNLLPKNRVKEKKLLMILENI